MIYIPNFKHYLVYVISKTGKPLMPTTPRKTRLLLKNNKAKVVKRTPFNIKLLYDTTEYTQNLTHGVDTGSSKIGSAVVSDDGKIVYLFMLWKIHLLIKPSIQISFLIQTQ